MDNSPKSIDDAKNPDNANDKGVIQNSYKAFESIVGQAKMFIHMTITVFLIILAVQILLITAAGYVTGGKIFTWGLTPHDVCILKTHYSLYAKEIFGFTAFGNGKIDYKCDGTVTNIEIKEFKRIFHNYIKSYLRPKFRRNLLILILPTCILYFLYYIFIKRLHEQHIKATADKFIRGKKFVTEEEMTVFMNDYAGKCRLFPLNNYVQIPETIVTRHNFIIGKPGSGKSQFIFKFVKELIDNDIKCIIHDFKGDFIPAFYNPEKHYIFNPVDARHLGINFKKENPNDMFSPEFRPDKDFNYDDESNLRVNPSTGKKERVRKKPGWTIFNELKTLMDIDAFTTSTIPDSSNGDQFWTQAPRDIFKAILIYCMKTNNKTNDMVYKLLKMSGDDLRERFQQFDDCNVGLQHLAEAKLSGQLISILSSKTSFLGYLRDTDGDFSISEWVQDFDHPIKALFIANQAMVQKTLAPMIATFFDFATVSLCSLPDDMKRRLYFILDEFGQLTKIGSVVQLLTQSRSKGGAAFILIQDQAQIEAIYGHELVKSIVNSCGNKFYFAVGDETTAEFISKELGTIEIERKKESKSFGVGDLKDNISISADIQERRIALASEIMTLKTMTCYAQMTDLPLTHVKLKYVPPESHHKGFIPRDFTIRMTAEEQAKADADVKAYEEAAQKAKEQEVQDVRSELKFLSDIQNDTLKPYQFNDESLDDDSSQLDQAQEFTAEEWKIIEETQNNPGLFDADENPDGLTDDIIAQITKGKKPKSHNDFEDIYDDLMEGQ